MRDSVLFLMTTTYLQKDVNIALKVLLLVSGLDT